jgi:hypothetical protein
LLGAVLSTLFGIYVGDRVQSGIGTFAGGLISTLAWGFLSQAYVDTRDRLAARTPRTLDLTALRTAAAGLSYLAVGVAPFLAKDIGPETDDITEPLIWPWIIYSVAYWVVADDDSGPLSYHGPFSFLADVAARALSGLFRLIGGIFFGFLACGLPAAIAAGVSWLDYAGYLSAVCGAMLALELWFPGKATTGFQEAGGVLFAIVIAGAPVGWIAYLATTG